MENSQVQTNKKNKKAKVLLTCGCIVLILCGIIGAGVPVALWHYDGTRNYIKDTILNRGTSDISQSQTNLVKNFSTDNVSQPSGSLINLVKQVSPAVVTVVVKTKVSGTATSDPTSLQTQEGIGTGFFVSDDGLLITNQHVTCDATKASDFSIVTMDNKSYNVISYTSDPRQDISIVKVDTKGQKVKYLQFVNPQTKIEVGESVVAVGNPLGVNPGSVTEGIISGLNRSIVAQGVCGTTPQSVSYDGVLQTDAAINPGNSGGPLLDMNGNVIGVNSVAGVGANNIGYSIPADRVLKVLNGYEKNGKIIYPYMGVSYKMIDDITSKSLSLPVGALIESVAPNSPANQAGIKIGDIVTKLNDKPVDISLQYTLSQNFVPGDHIKVEVYRYTTTNVMGQDVPLQGKTIVLDLIVADGSAFE